MCAPSTAPAWRRRRPLVGGPCPLLPQPGNATSATACFQACSALGCPGGLSRAAGGTRYISQGDATGMIRSEQVQAHEMAGGKGKTKYRQRHEISIEHRVQAAAGAGPARARTACAACPRGGARRRAGEQVHCWCPSARAVVLPSCSSSSLPLLNKLARPRVDGGEQREGDEGQQQRLRLAQLQRAGWGSGSRERCRT